MAMFACLAMAFRAMLVSRRQRRAKMYITASIDPGKSGAIAIDDGKRPAHVYDMPMMVEGKRHMPNGAALAEILREHGVNRVVIEWVVPMGSKDGRARGIKSTGDFLYGAGVLYGVAAAIGAEVVFVSPAKWKRAQDLIGKTKEASRSLAVRKFPKLASMLKRVKDEGRAEALLILDWFHRTMPAPALP